jgi:hypothetical protein
MTQTIRYKIMEFYIKLTTSYGDLTSNCLGHTIPFDILNVL